MAFTQAQLTELEEAIASPEKTVKFNGREYTKAELSDLMKAYNLIKEDLATTTSLTRSPFSVVKFT